ncbi:hypothetical protein I5G81_gp02 [Mycobacterium phage Shandong1]|uniref:Uncharacterized protein n=1 Tax=Mycobacterium phage Shandong1 TaxID=1983447 RepID=A0A1X9SH90_9CAUD|nr:hypothetical protein I5G81_gp02 [Mycobacterium phage Shandong1]ARQ95441.1 hypothetical protein [Mycobacterium phage Shandong1]
MPLIARLIVLGVVELLRVEVFLGLLPVVDDDQGAADDDADFGFSLP